MQRSREGGGVAGGANIVGTIFPPCYVRRQLVVRCDEAGEPSSPAPPSWRTFQLDVGGALEAGEELAGGSEEADGGLPAAVVYFVLGEGEEGVGDDGLVLDRPSEHVEYEAAAGDEELEAAEEEVAERGGRRSRGA